MDFDKLKALQWQPTEIDRRGKHVIYDLLPQEQDICISLVVHDDEEGRTLANYVALNCSKPWIMGWEQDLKDASDLSQTVFRHLKENYRGAPSNTVITGLFAIIAMALNTMPKEAQRWWLDRTMQTLTNFFADTIPSRK